MPPEFFLDRSLGRGVAEGLTELGWRVHRATEHFPRDAQETSDETWLAYGLESGWTPLCKDGRIKGRRHEREPLIQHRGVLFYLNSQRLLREEMIRRFHAAQTAIYQCVSKGGPAAYAVGVSGIYQTWP